MSIVFSVFTYGCELSTSIGLDFVEDEPLQLMYLDSIDLDITTVIFDSIRTSGQGRLLLGHATDEYLGEVTSLAYFKISTDSMVNNIPDNSLTSYSKLILDLTYDEYWYYDTTQEFTFYIYPLLEELEPNDDLYLYNTSSFSYLSDSISAENYISKFSFFPKPHNTHEEFELNNEFGITLYRYLQDEGDIRSYEFQEDYYGFVLVPDKSNNCFIGINPESKMIIQYNKEGGAFEEDLWFGSDLYFSQIEGDRTNTLLSNLEKQTEDIPSCETGELSFMQGGTGIALKVALPNLKYIRELNKNLYITEAILELYPLKDSFDKHTYLTPDLSSSVVNEYNRLITDTLNYENLLFLDPEFEVDNFYSIEITTYVQSQINDVEYDGEGLLINFDKTDTYVGINRLCIDDQNYKSKLKLLFLSVNE